MPFRNEKNGLFQNVLNGLEATIVTTDRTGYLLLKNAVSNSGSPPVTWQGLKKLFRIATCPLDRSNHKVLKSLIDRRLSADSRIPLLSHSILYQSDIPTIPITKKVSPIFHPKILMEWVIGIGQFKRAVEKMGGPSRASVVAGDYAAISPSSQNPSSPIDTFLDFRIDFPPIFSAAYISCRPLDSLLRVESNSVNKLE